jgi:ornithine--oxo-acid transaminase
MLRQVIRKTRFTPLLHAIKNQSRSVYTFKNLSSEECLKTEYKYGCHNYAPIPVVCARASGVHIWDPEGKRYYDFLSAYSAVNQGHCHPKIIQALTDQAPKITLCSRAFHSQVFAEWTKYMCETFGYSAVLPMNTGAEGVESAMKLARKWGYYKKGIPEGEAYIIAAKENFHGRTIAIISMSTDPTAYKGYEPLVPGVMTVKYNSVEALEKVLNQIGPKVAAFLVEPIQGEAGVYVPDSGYLKKVAELCKKHNVLFIADEVQTGLGRTGKMLCVEHDGVRPDVVILGKALSGGVYPVSAVLADREIMDVIEPGTHGSTYGGNPLACAVSIAALEVIKDEGLVERARHLGTIMEKHLNALVKPGGIVTEARGKGLLWAIVIDHSNKKLKGLTAYDICLKLKDKGLLAKQTHDNIIRFAPPLVITENQLTDCLGIIKGVIDDIENQ